MKARNVVGAALLLAATAVQPAFAATQYGTAVVEQGSITILREGKALTFNASSEPIAVNVQDTVRVREASRITMKTNDKATVTLGANAVFQCEPWQAEKRSGTFRMLFGRMRANVQGLAGEDRFNVKTATATIGVKGTQYGLAQSSSGNTAVLGIESTVTTAGPDGVEQPVGPNQMSAVVGGNPATQSVAAPDEFKAEMAKVDSPPPGSQAALNLPAETVLVDKGIVSKEALTKSKEDRPQAVQQASNTQAPMPSINLDDAQQAGQAFRGKLNLRFEK